MGRKKSKVKLKMRPVKMGKLDAKLIDAKARRYADGNVSAWIRYSAKKYTPKRGEKVSLKAG